MKFTKFIFLTTIGTVIWNIIIISFGKIAGNSWDLIEGIISKYLVVLVTIGIIIMSIKLFKKRKRLYNKS